MLSVVITSHRDEATCYLTAYAIAAQLEQRAIPHEIIIVADGGTETKWEKEGFTCLRVNTGSPQGSRDAGIRAARFKNVLVLESHVVVSDAYQLLNEHLKYGAAMTFCQRRGEGPELFDVYGSTTNWTGNLWYKNLVYQKHTTPFRIAQFGHSCFMLDREWYLNSGGYTNLFTGWGGEEPYLCLKAWMLGRECWMIPDLWHAHHLAVGAHGDQILGNSYEYNRNFQMLGYLIAGREHPSVLADGAMERRRIVSGPFQGNVNELREHLNKIGAMN